jgi:very-short-patch-repair endonuclease
MAQINSIFNFLKDYNELSNPVITEIDKQKWSLKISNLPHIKEVWSIYHVQDFSDLKILEVKRPMLAPCPPPSELIIEWIEGNWNDISAAIINHKEKIVEESEEEDGSITEIEEYFNENEERVNNYKEWIIKRNDWRKIELPKQQGLELYNSLFKLYSDIKKESESVELILGDGHIKWSTDSRIIDHPVLLQRVQLEFDSEKPSFIIKCDELKSEIYSPMLRVIPSVNQVMLSTVIQDVENNEYHIADTANINGVFQRLINVVDEKGKYVEEFERSYNGPMIKSEPVLFLRKRTLGFSIFIDKIIEEIENNEDIVFPDFFENMVGNYKEHNETEIIEDSWNQSGIDKDILLTLPANNEQLKIIRYLNSYGAVLVQGPPGTGKTHTIANLIGHLLSQGSSVLVTSHTEKALTVLKEKVYRELQSLCISLLSSSSQKKEMDSSLFEIAEKGTSLDLGDTRKKIARLEEERKRLVESSQYKSKELLSIRSLEYKDLVFSNTTIRPIEAAKFIKSGEGKYDYVPGTTIDDTIGLPLSMEEARDLYLSNGQIKNDEEELLSKELPSLDSLWTAEDFEQKAGSYFNYLKKLNDWKPMLILKEDIEEGVIHELLKISVETHDSLKNMEDYQLSIVERTMKDKVYNTFWSSVFGEFDVLMKTYGEYRKILFENDLKISEDLIANETLDILNEIIGSGKEIPVNFIAGLTKPKWKKLRDSISMNNRVLENRSDYEKVRLIVQYELKRRDLISKINKLLTSVSGKVNISIDNFEERTEQLRKKIQLSIQWYEDKWMTYIITLKSHALSKAKFEELCSFDIDQAIESIASLLHEIIIPDLNQRLNYELFMKITREWEDFNNYINSYKFCGGPFNELIQAVKEKDPMVYRSTYNIIKEIYNKNDIYVRRSILINKLNSIAPEWAWEIKNRIGIHGETDLPEDLENAWKWRQLTNQINRIDRYDANKIQSELRDINETLISNAKKLAYEKAWYEKVKSKTAVQTQAIEGWRQTMKQIGKGTGKTAPLLLKKARELMPLCQTAIPVWIMPLNRVAENFDPQKNKFDVVIIDEASQSDILALSALYLGNKVIIVGDDEQVSPDTVGIKTEEISALIEQHLQGVPNNHLFNGRTSVYDMAKASGFKPLMLTEHFRCLPEIIEFSNELSYNGKIKPLRDASGVTVRPPVIEYRVPNASRGDNKVNEVEAEHIASMICSCIESDVYKGKTIGVISLLGQEQAYEIDRLLQSKLDPREYEERRIQCGTAPQFQGDERDLIFLSVVDSPSEKGGPIRLVSEEGKNDINRKRYNVAASRARDQMWVVHSLNPEIDLKPDDIRLKLIKYAMNPSIDRNNENLELAESDFETQVMKRLLNRGYKIIPQWKVGAYRIDMIIEDGDKRIALECDGEKWHTIDDLPNDLKRQAILERLGWRFIRIRGSAFYRDPDGTMDSVYEELEKNEVRPNYFGIDEVVVQNDATVNELIESIKRRANEFRMEWNGENLEDQNFKANEVIYSTLNEDAQINKSNILLHKEDEEKIPIPIEDSINDNLKSESSEDLVVRDIKARGRSKYTFNKSDQLSMDEIIVAVKSTNNEEMKKEQVSNIIDEINEDKLSSGYSATSPSFDCKNNVVKNKDIKSNNKYGDKKEKEITKEKNEKDSKKEIPKPQFDFRKR